MALSSDRILSRPCEVFWLGFRSTTYQLQQQGWELAIEQDFMQGSIRLLMRHQDMKLYAISDRQGFDYYRYAGDISYPPPVFHVVQAATRFDVAVIQDNFSKFGLVDAVPMFSNSERKSIEDFGIFATPLVRTEEIIVDPADVSKMLEQIMSMQSPEQKAIRERERLRDNRNVVPEARKMQNFHAQIISLSNYRNAA